MTLKEKLNNSIITNINIVESENRMCYDYNHLELAEKCEKIAEEFAVNFTDWCEDYYYPSSTKGIWFDKPDFDNAKQFLTRELLQIYKDKKGL
jgi:hypothetical protein